jgi:hydrogenase nickel incorporation protein HypA/HybF
MHELPVTRSILDIALATAREAGGGRITSIHLVIGDLSRIVDDCVQFYWDILSEGTPAQGASLRIRRVPLEMECRGCGRRFQPGDADYRCPACSGSRVRVVGGDDLRVEAIDLEPEPAAADSTRSV